MRIFLLAITLLLFRLPAVVPRPQRLAGPFLIPQLPPFTEEAGVGNAARRARRHGHVHIDDRVIRQFWHLAGVIEIVVFAESEAAIEQDRKSTRLNSSHVSISYAV